jgi:hypothetical protein
MYMARRYRWASALTAVLVLGFQILLMGSLFAQSYSGSGPYYGALPSLPGSGVDVTSTVVGDVAISPDTIEYSPPKPPDVPPDPTINPAFASKPVAEQFETLRAYRNGLVEAVRTLTSQLQEESGRLTVVQQTKLTLDGIRRYKPFFPTRESLESQNTRAADRMKSIQNDIKDGTTGDKAAALKSELDAATFDFDQTRQLIATYDSRLKDFKQQIEERDNQAITATKLVSSVGALIRDNTDLLGKLNSLLSNADEKIASLFGKNDAGNNFKKTMSITFALLVGAVILGFFVIAFRDESVRKAIFSNESGIQFITLFSLVIAIILFGIVEVLEGKELAALLGGLSGYILGRGTAKPGGS